MCSEDELGVDSSGRPMPPCPHFLAERAARQAKQRGAYDREVLAGRTAEAEQLDAVKGSAAATSELAAAIRAQVASQQPAPAAPTLTDAPATEPPKAPAKK